MGILLLRIAFGGIMDLGRYIKKSQNHDYGEPQATKVCLECGKEIDKESAGHLYYQKFCSRNCKEKYVGMQLD